MAYDKQEIYEQAVELSIKEGFFFIQDIIDYLACGKTTFYTFFPDSSDELNDLKNNLYKNRIQEKIKIRKKLLGGSGGELIALYKLLGTDDERRKLSTNYNNVEQATTLNISSISKEKLKEISNSLDEEV